MRPVLVTDGGRGQNHNVLGTVRALATAGRCVHVTVSGSFSTAAWSRHCAARLRVPPVTDPRYAAAVRELMDLGRYVAVLPASDAALVALGWPGSQLVDKAVVSLRARDAGFPAAAEKVFADGAELLARRHDLTYPLVVKAVRRSGTDAAGAWRADRPEDLRRADGLPGPLLVQRWLEGRPHVVAGVVWDGALRAVVHQRPVRTWPRVCGVSSLAVSVEPDLDLERRLVRLLDGYQGIFQAQLIGEHLHDVNPRVYGSIQLAAAAGANLPDILCRLAGGEDVGRPAPVRGRPGVRYRWVEGDVRHVLTSWRGGQLSGPEAVRALRPARATVHPDVSLCDPLPTAARVLYAARAGLGGS